MRRAVSVLFDNCKHQDGNDRAEPYLRNGNADTNGHLCRIVLGESASSAGLVAVKSVARRLSTDAIHGGLLNKGISLAAIISDVEFVKWLRKRRLVCNGVCRSSSRTEANRMAW